MRPSAIKVCTPVWMVYSCGAQIRITPPHVLVQCLQSCHVYNWDSGVPLYAH